MFPPPPTHTSVCVFQLTSLQLCSYKIGEEGGGGEGLERSRLGMSEGQEAVLTQGSRPGGWEDARSVDLGVY